VVFTHHYWLFGACSQRMGLSDSLLIGIELIEASLDDRQAAEEI